MGILHKDQISTSGECRPGPLGVEEARIEIEDAVAAGVSMPQGGLRTYTNPEEKLKQHPGIHSTGAFVPRKRAVWFQPEALAAEPLSDRRGVAIFPVQVSGSRSAALPPPKKRGSCARRAPLVLTDDYVRRVRSPGRCAVQGELPTPGAAQLDMFGRN